jgi:cellulose synthase/poly-beta-1,6-N-acetylglucosamine synthase-like glycosyltransferase
MNLNAYLHQWPLLVFILFCFLSFLQIGYYLFFFIRLAFYRTKTDRQFQTHPVSVIICARDEAENLSRYLPGILVQQYNTTHEVLVVNDNSFDDTKYVLEELQKSFRHLQKIDLIQEAKLIPGKKFPLSMGIKSAKYEIMLLTDADCIPASEFWIESMQSCYRDQTEIVLGYSPYFKKKGLLNKLIRWDTYHTALQYMSYALAGMPYMGVGRNLSYKKAVFMRNKGFSSHHQIPGGDDDLFINMAANKKNTSINIDQASFVLTKPARSWSQWIRQKSRHTSTGRYYRFKHKILLGLYSFSQFLYYPALIVASVFFDWKWSLGIASVRLLLQLVVHVRTMKKLNEQDLIPWMLLFDLWMPLYYLLFLPALILKPRPTWK